MCLNSQTSYNYFSFVIKDILTETNDLNFFEFIIKVVIFQNIELLSIDQCNSNNSNSKNAIQLINFQINLLNSLYYSCISTYQLNKIIILNIKFTGLIKNKDSIFSSTLLILGFFEKLNITDNYEVFMNGISKDIINKINIRGVWPFVLYFKKEANSLNCINDRNDNLYNILLQQFKNITKLNFQNPTSNISNSNTYSINNKIIDSAFKSSYYPSIYIRHDIIYNYLIQLLNQDETSLSLCELILKVLNNQLKKVNFFVNLKLVSLVNALLSINDIKKFLFKPTFMEILLQTIYSLSSCFIKFHPCIRDLMFKKSIINKYEYSKIDKFYYNDIKQKKLNNHFIILDEQLSNKYLLFVLNSIKSLINSFLIEVKPNDLNKNTNTNNYLSNTSLKEITNLKNLSLSPKDKNTGFLSNIFNRSNSNDKIMANEDAEKKSKDVYLDKLYLKKVKYDLRFGHITKLLNSLHLYLLQSFKELIDLNHLYNINTSDNKNCKDEIYCNFKNNRKKLLEILNSVYDILCELTKICYFSLDLCISLINFLFCIKDILNYTKDDNIIIKYIYLVMIIVWTRYKNYILKYFNELFSLKFKNLNLNSDNIGSNNNATNLNEEYKLENNQNLIKKSSNFYKNVTKVNNTYNNNCNIKNNTNVANYSLIDVFYNFKITYMQNLGDSLIYYLSQELTNFNMYNACYNIFISANGLDKYTINVFDSSNNFNYGNITSEYHSNLLCASLIRKKLSMRENVFLLMLKWIEDNKLLNNTINLSTNNTIKENSYRNTNNIDNNYKIINSKKHKLDINKHNSNKHILAVRDNWYNSRDNISLELRKKINCKYESVYLCEQTIITIHPVNNKLFNVYLRNPIANISFSIDLSMENSINQLTHDDCLNELLEDIEVNNIDDNIIDNNSNNSTNKHINLINENLNDEENINIQYISKHIKRNSNSYNTCFASIEKLDSKLNNNNNNNNDNNIVLNSKNYLKSVHKKRHSVEIKSNKSNLNSDLNSNKNNILQYNNYLIGNIVFKRVMSNLTEVNKENVIFTEVTNDKNIVELVSSIDHTPVYYTIEASVLYYQNKSKKLKLNLICIYYYILYNRLFFIGKRNNLLQRLCK